MSGHGYFDLLGLGLPGCDDGRFPRCARAVGQAEVKADASTGGVAEAATAPEFTGADDVDRLGSGSWLGTGRAPSAG
jgi:hypothetical protein